MNSADKPLKYKRPTSSDSRLWYEQKHHSLSMFEREQSENKIVDELEYDDCDVTVQDKTLTIDEQIRTIGFQVGKNKTLPSWVKLVDIILTELNFTGPSVNRKKIPLLLF